LNSSPIASGIAGLLAQQPESDRCPRRERVLEEEQTVRLERLAQVDRLVERDALVHVVQQLDLRRRAWLRMCSKNFGSIRT
jgi:hypothetical protein